MVRNLINADSRGAQSMHLLNCPNFNMVHSIELKDNGYQGQF